MTEAIFDHDRLDGYRLTIRYAAAAFDVSKTLGGLHAMRLTSGFAPPNRSR
jgi:hypothetical protein